MKRFNIFSVAEGSHFVIRDDMKHNHKLLKALRKIVPAACAQIASPDDAGCGDGGGGSGDGGGDGDGDGDGDSSGDTGGGFDYEVGAVIQLPGAPNATSTSFFWGPPDSDFENYQSIFDIPGNPPYVGPWWTFPKIVNCATISQNKVGAAMKDVAEGLVAGLILNGAKYQVAPALLGAAKAYLAGTISLAAFMDVFFACVSATAMPEILAAAGVTLQFDSLIEFLKCEMAGK